MADENEEQERRRKSEREISEHDRVMARNGAHASRDTLHDASADQQPGAYTTEQARDRAAHTPSLLETRDVPRSLREEERMVEELYREMFSTDEARRAFERETNPKAPPVDAEELQQWQDLREPDGAAQPDAGKDPSTGLPVLGLAATGDDGTIFPVDVGISETPEPSSLVLLAAGLTGLGIARRRKLY